MVLELGAIIRNQIPSGRASLLDAYGEILLRAWRDSNGASLLAIEDLIQVLGDAIMTFTQLNSVIIFLILLQQQIHIPRVITGELIYSAFDVTLPMP